MFPFTELQHTADIAYLVTGKNFSELYLHAQLAIVSFDPSFRDFIEVATVNNLQELVQKINQRVALYDVKVGARIKAVSYHGDAVRENGFLRWEMIIDV